MAKYIKAEDAIEVANFECGQFRGIFGRIKERLEATPTADVVPVVRCKDCKWWKLSENTTLNTLGIHICKKNDDVRGEYDFCSRGERREDVEETD